MAESRLPFSLSGRSWAEFTEQEQGRWYFLGEDFLPRGAAGKVRLLSEQDWLRVDDWARAGLPRGWPDYPDVRFPHQETLAVPCAYAYGDEADAARVRRWLFDRGVPFSRTVYLMYDWGVLETTWRLVVRHWEAFTHSVGFAMVAVDHTLQWAGCFHHEEVFIFGSNSGFRRGLEPDLERDRPRREPGL